MKVYTKTKEKKNRKSLLALIIGFVLIAIAIIITLCVTLSGPSQDVGGNVIPPNNEQTEQYVMPLSEYTMGQDFSDKLVYNQTLKQWRTHNGVDFIAEKGTPVMAILGGTVKSIENTTLEGTVITIEQSDGIITIYKSLSADVNVEEGATVKAGDVIGSVDVTMATEKKEGAHLHLEMKKDGAYLSPLDYLPDGSDK
ncbi:MAG: M23 family metallopeptidase [Clostridiales bacterium]|nr:M23 family metallopeptidase [Clostridiales bacterium]